MHEQKISAIANDVIESGRVTAKNVIATSQDGTRRVLSACDQVWGAATNTLAYDRGLISQKLRDDLLSLQGQLTLLTRYFANSATDRAESAVNDIAGAANSTVGEYERMFDARVMQTMTRVGMPIAEVIRTLAELVASLSQELAALVAIEREQIAMPDTPRSKSAPKTARKAARRGKPARGHA